MKSRANRLLDKFRSKLHSPVRRALLSTFVSTGVNLVSQLGQVPLLLLALGARDYGIWMVLNAIPAYFQMADLGISVALAVAMTAAVAEENRERAVELYHSGCVMLLSALAVIMLLGVVLAYSGVLTTIVLGSEYGRGYETVEVLLILQVGLSIVSGLFSAAYRCIGLYPTMVYLNSAKRFVLFVVTVSVMWKTKSYLHAAQAIALVQLAFLIYMYFDIGRKAPWLKIGTSGASVKTVKHLLAPSIANLSIPFSYALMLQGTTIFVQHILGPVAVSAYTTARTMCRMVNMLTDNVQNGIGPELTSQISKGNLDRARAITYKANGLCVAMGAAALPVLYFVGPIVYEVWTRGRVQADPILLLGFGFTLFCNSFWNAAVAVMINTNRQTEFFHLFILYGLTACLACGAACWMGAQYSVESGLRAAAFSGALAELLLDLTLVSPAVRVLGGTRKDYYLSWLPPRRAAA